MAFLDELGGITAGVGAEGLAFAAGFAAAPALEPAAVTLRQDSWNAAQVRRLDAMIAAAIAAEDIAHYDDMANEASYSGYESSRFAYLYHVNLIAPGMGELLQMARRQTINPGNFTHGLRKNKFEPMWDGALTDLQNVYLSPDILAVMLQRNVIPNQGQLPGVDLSTTGKVPRFPHVPIDAYAMASTFGWSNDQLDAQARIQGLPPGMDLVARMVFRSILDRGDFNLAAEQSNRRVEWADYEFDGYRQIPTADQFVEDHLRGWRTKQEMYDGTALHGMSQADTDVLFQIHRRPLTAHQIKQALARGASFNPEAGEITDPFTASVHQANLGPEWYEMAVALQGSYPPLFQVNRLVTAGIIDADTGADWMRKSGEADEVVTALHAFWSQTPVVKADPHVTKAETQLWTTIHTMHKKGEITDAIATAALPSAGVSAAAIPQVLKIWDVESSLVNGTFVA